MSDERDRGGEAPQQPQERKIEALPGESFHQYLKRISSMPRREGESGFVTGGPEIGPILIFRSQTPAPTEPAESTPGVRELTDDESFNRLGGLHVERIETERQRVETGPPPPPELTEEEKVAELYQAYLTGGKEAMKEVLRRRDEAYLRSHPGAKLPSAADSQKS